MEGSLHRLKTDRIDIHWAHCPHGVTPGEEIVRGFEHLARAGKILYAGLSNLAAWRLARPVTPAAFGHAVSIVAAQFQHSLVHRAPEADLFPASEALGLSAEHLGRFDAVSGSGPSAPARKPVPWASDERARRAVA